MHPVELPPRFVALELGRRRHRRLTAPAGVLLFVCAFLPIVPGCNDQPFAPVDAPYLLPPYLFGLAIGLAAAARTARGLGAAISGIRALTGVVLATAAVAALASAPLGVIGGVPAVLVLAAIGWRGGSERAVALCAVVLGAVATLWFGLFVSAPEVFAGVYASLVASVGLLVGGLVWLGETSHL